MNPPTLFSADGAALLVVDVQGKLLARMARGPRVVANVDRLIRAAEALAIPVHATEQYPKGLGPTVPALAERLPTRTEKTCFHAADALPRGSARHVTVAGIEAHVCIAQSALELVRRGVPVQVPADAVASRFDFDWEVALRRLESAGVVVTTTEAVLFEWVGGSDHPAFKAISALVKEPPPPPG